MDPIYSQQNLFFDDNGEWGDKLRKLLITLKGRTSEKSKKFKKS